MRVLLAILGAAMIVLGLLGLRFTDRLLRGGAVVPEAAKRGERDPIVIRGCIAAICAGVLVLVGAGLSHSAS